MFRILAIVGMMASVLSSLAIGARGSVNLVETSNWLELGLRDGEGMRGDASETVTETPEWFDLAIKEQVEGRSIPLTTNWFELAMQDAQKKEKKRSLQFTIPTPPTNRPTAVPSTGTTTNGYAIAYVAYNKLDTSCSSTPRYAVLYPLGSCITSSCSESSGSSSSSSSSSLESSIQASIRSLFESAPIKTADNDNNSDNNDGGSSNNDGYGSSSGTSGSSNNDGYGSSGSSDSENESDSSKSDNESIFLSSDSQGNIYYSGYRGTFCSGAPSYTYQASAGSTSSCKCDHDNCGRNWQYSATFPALPNAAWPSVTSMQVVTSYTGTGCTGAVRSTNLVFNPQYCSPGCVASDSGRSKSYACSTTAGSPTPAPNAVATPVSSTTTLYTAGTITTGYAVSYITFPSADITCATAKTLYMYPLGTCFDSSSESSERAEHGSYDLSADVDGNIYFTWYSLTSCTGTSKVSKATRTYCTCTFGSCSSSWYYMASVPTLPYYNAQQATVTSVSSGAGTSTCSGGVGKLKYIYMQFTQPSCSATCTSSTDSRSGTILSFQSACQGTAASPTAAPTSGIVTTGYAVVSATFASTDTTCTAGVVSGTAYRLGVCIPSYDTSTALPTGAFIASADSQGRIYVNSYTSTTCTGKPAYATAVPYVPCSCTPSACSNGFIYVSSLPTTSASAQVSTRYLGTNCVTPYAYTYAFGVSSCTAATCLSSTANGITYSDTTTCVGGASTVVSEGAIKTGYAILSATFAPSDGTCQTATSSTIRPLGVCIPNSGTQWYTLSADSAGALYTTYYPTSTCTTGTSTGTSAVAQTTCTCSTTQCILGGKYYGSALPSLAGQMVSTLTVYSGSACSGTAIAYGYLLGSSAAGCVASTCATTTTSGVTTSLSQSCQLTVAPTPAPVVTFVVAVAAKVTLSGVSPAQFLSSTQMQVDFKTSISNAVGVPVSAITINGATRRLRRALLDTSVSYTVTTSSTTTTATALQSSLSSVSATSALGASLFTYGVTSASGSTAIVTTVVGTPTAAPYLVVASRTSSSSGSSSAGSCFAGSEQVTLESGDVKAMAEVRVGDRVLSVNAKGEAVYSDVVSVPHAPNSHATTFAQIGTESGRDLKMTMNHVLPAGSCAAAVLPYVSAARVAVGDCVQTVSGREQVVSVGKVEGKGVYTIVAMEELIVVNGIVATPFGGVNPTLANCYYNLHRVWYAYAALALSVLPLRAPHAQARPVFDQSAGAR